MDRTILVTGASGFLGSALCVDLSRDHKIIGLHRRPLPEKLKKATPLVQWEKSEVEDRDCIDWIFTQNALKGRPIDYVIHFAAYVGFKKKWQDEHSDTNVIGTRNIIEAASNAGVKRILFAGSVAALDPLPIGRVLTEKSLAGGKIAYSRSKALGEKMLFENSYRVPAVVLRLGGVFTDWCELPPLFSIMNMWTKPFIGRMMPGHGMSGFPYIHRRDVVQIVRRIIEKNNSLGRFETLFASPGGCTCHKDLFPIIRRESNETFSINPLHVSLFFARMALHGKYFFNTLRNRKTYERAWMLDYADRPLVVDTTYTREKLDWEPRPGLHILERLPILLQKFNRHFGTWHIRNINRNDQKYEYNPD
ncbi:MAG: NAD(P)-dependent oxidoreductase [Desulfobacula sp.]|uniref:NAD-dependent epimerase/dehydratase family protein n=1 Tax=Desulfobacula sp. TaxID=2593537 RepID=UPI0025BE89B8|nr:NAD(P)-dependent oxidoreductase [Desulfobacula sp.]MCD4721337.1 NAD(P)-dependent oxidoreductase [Desulfobacula sp.]